MTVRSFPFAGQESAEDDYYRLHRQTGVLSGLDLTLNGLAWSLSPGEMFVGGSMMLVETDPESGASTATTGANPRRDMLVARRTLLPAGGSDTVVALLQGDTASSPVDPTPDGEVVGVFEGPLWSWQVPGSGGTVVTDVRDLRLRLASDGASPLIEPVVGPTNAIPIRTGEVDSWANFTIRGRSGNRPYRIRTSAVVRSFATDCMCTTRVRVGSSALAPGTEPIVSEVSNASINTGLDLTHPSRLSGVITGPARIVGHALRTAGGGGWEITPAPSLVYEVIPA